MPDAAAHDELVRAWFVRTAAVVHERRVWLTDLDAAIGDGDHGINLDRGFAALLADLDAQVLPPGDPAATLTAGGRRLMGIVGGASGALYGRGLMVAGERVRERAAAGSLGRTELAKAILEGMISGIEGLGHAVPGEKTMLDALVPAAAILRHPPTADPVAALLAAAGAADLGAQMTIPLIARKGRASYLGERSAGHEDPGAASAAILVRCLADAAADRAPDA